MGSQRITEDLYHLRLRWTNESGQGEVLWSDLQKPQRFGSFEVLCHHGTEQVQNRDWYRHHMLVDGAVDDTAMLSMLGSGKGILFDPCLQVAGDIRSACRELVDAEAQEVEKLSRDVLWDDAEGVVVEVEEVLDVDFVTHEEVSRDHPQQPFGVPSGDQSADRMPHPTAEETAMFSEDSVPSDAYDTIGTVVASTQEVADSDRVVKCRCPDTVVATFDRIDIMDVD